MKSLHRPLSASAAALFRRMPRPLPAALSAALVLGAPAALLLAPAAAQAQAASQPQAQDANTLLQQAEQLLAAGQAAEAVAKAQEAAALPGANAVDKVNSDLLIGRAATRAGQDKLALDAYDRVLASGKLGPDEAARLSTTQAQLAFRAKDYARSARYAQQALAATNLDGGARLDLMDLQGRALYLGDDFNGAAKAVTAWLDALPSAGRQPTEDNIRLLASCYLQAKDEAGYGKALERMLVAYPKPGYWADMLARTARAHNLNPAQRLELLRLGRATGGITGADASLEAADLALRAGLPGEARQLLKQGLDANTFKPGADTTSARQMLERANKAAAADQKTADEQARRLSGQGLFGLGHALALDGQAERGLALMQQALGQGGVKNANEAWLQLGALQAEAGLPAARDSLAKVQGSDATAALARLWRIHKKLG
jgi:hypothetical protein